ncbi:hypothetical protein M3Y94_01288000 [Aphelenchoides besseyi]|nr:hypothetical protein M3Y94_01288000 [Aphelenchoides besseyi]
MLKTLLVLLAVKFVRSQNFEDISSLAATHPNQHLPLTNFFNLYYVGTISIGTPPRTFTFLFDTGSTLSWLKSQSCRLNRYDGQPCNSIGRQPYGQFESWSSRSERKNFRIFYDDGGRVMGTIFSDVFMIGLPFNATLALKGVEFGVATIINADSDLRPFDGIFGLGFGRDNQPNFVQRAASSGQIRLPIFSFYLPSASKRLNEVVSSNGQVTFGGVDLRRCSRWAIYTSVLSGRDWRFRSGGIWVNGYPMVTSAVISADSGTSTIIVPTFVFQRIAVVFGLNKTAVPPVDCQRKFAFRIQIGRQFLTLTETHLITRYLIDGREKCNLQVAPSDSDLWVFGTPVFRSFCQIFDFGRKRLGFASVIA